MAGQSGGGGSREKAKTAKLTKAIMDKNRSILAKKKNSDARSKAAAKQDAKTPAKTVIDGVPNHPLAFNRSNNMRDQAHDKYWRKRGVKANMADTPNPTRYINKKTKVQSSRAY